MSVVFSFVVVWLLTHVQLFCDPMDYSPPGSSVHGILQARRTGVWEVYDSKGQARITEEYDKNGNLQKKYLYLYANEHPQKINQSLIAYFQKKGETKTVAILKNGNKIEATESLATIVQWLDMLEFVKITPKLYAEMSCVRGYKNIDAQSVRVLLKPALDYEVIAEGEDAASIRSLFATGEPKEN